MSLLQVDTPFNISLQFSTAPFHIRFFAWFIDLVFILLYQIGINYLSAKVFSYGTTQGLEIFFSAIPLFGYHLFFEMINNGQSPGKMVLGIKVVSMDGHNASTPQLLIRWLTRFVDFGIIWSILFFTYQEYFLGSILIITSLLSFILFLSTPYNQRLGDLAAGTIMVYKRLPYNFSDTIFREIKQDSYSVTFPEVMRLSDNDINIINNVVNRHRKAAIPKYVESIAAKIKSALAINPKMADDIFLEVLLTDYNYLSKK